MPKVEVTEKVIKCIQITLSESEAQDLENILYNKVEEYKFDDSEILTAKRLKGQLSEVLK